MLRMYSRLFFLVLMTAQVLFGDPVLSFSPETVIYLVRHGETDANANNLVQGSTDFPLNDVGRKQARAAAEELRCIPFAAAYSSDLDRARETAAILLDGRGMCAHPDRRVRERGFGRWEGRSMDDYYAESLEERNKDSEPTEAVRERAMEALNAFVKSHQGQTVLVVAHGALIKFVIAPMMGCTSGDLKIGNLGFAKLVYHEGKWSVADLRRIECSAPASR